MEKEKRKAKNQVNANPFECDPRFTFSAAEFKVLEKEWSEKNYCVELLRHDQFTAKIFRDNNVHEK